MKTRIISAIVMLPLLLLVYFGGIWLKLACIAISFIGLKEFYDGFRNEGAQPCYIIGYCSIILLYVLHFAGMSLEYFNGGAGQYAPGRETLALLWAFVSVAASLIYGMDVEKRKNLDVVSTLTGIFYVVFFVYFVVLIDESEYAHNYIWLIFIIAFGTDIFAYFSGMLLGKHKLCPNLSPKKTVEGAVGGVIGSMVFSVLFGVFFLAQGHALSIRFIIMACIGSVVAQLGDLTASAFKRKMGIKDYGNLIPGHGGILDRFDSVLFVAPYLYFYIAVILPIFI